MILSNNALPVAFDAKEVSKENRWPLAKLQKHQYEYLKDSTLTGAFAFLLLGFWRFNKFYILPFHELEKRRAAWKAGGRASIRPGEPGLVEVEFMDYLRKVAKIWKTSSPISTPERKH